ncbi:hypothetical protein L1987_04381 [Smallanthus sonchifolius]|nr:hypothetical protein L1987_04381 [Smallanthus sonchifolius]
MCKQVVEVGVDLLILQRQLSHFSFLYPFQLQAMVQFYMFILSRRPVLLFIQELCKMGLFGSGPALIHNTKISSQRRNHHTSLNLLHIYGDNQLIFR